MLRRPGRLSKVKAMSFEDKAWAFKAMAKKISSRPCPKQVLTPPAEAVFLNYM